MNQLLLNSGLTFNRIFWPQYCLLCNAAAGEQAVCPACLAELPLHDAPACPICAHPSAHALDRAHPATSDRVYTDICGDCLKHPPRFLRSLAAYTYRFPLDKLIGALKYHQQFAVIDILTAPLIALAAGPLPDALVAMPLHPHRLRERGFNQSLLLARRIARQLRLPLLQTACRRVRDTPPQTTLPVKQRRSNLGNAFTCADSVAGKRIGIVDDVMTSGSSLDSLAQALLQAGALEVECWVAARATLP